MSIIRYNPDDKIKVSLDPAVNGVNVIFQLPEDDSITINIDDETALGLMYELEIYLLK